MFSKLYDRVMQWSRHPHAVRYLVLLSFVESAFFPGPPPDVMLAPMSLADVKRAWRYAAITTAASVAGGVFGYLIGMAAFDMVEPVLRDYGYWSEFEQVKAWFDEYGVWAIFIAGFSPIPYKLFTISAGVVAMSFFPFVIASFVGRGARFFLVAGLMVLGGVRMEALLRRYVDLLGWLVVALGVLWFLLKG